MSRRRWQDYDQYDDYDSSDDYPDSGGIGDFSDYDYYYGSGANREYQRGRSRNAGRGERKSRDTRGRRDRGAARGYQSDYGSREDAGFRRDIDRTDRRFRMDLADFDEKKNAGTRKSASSGGVYLLMTLFFMVMVSTVFLGKMYLNQMGDMSSESFPLPVSSEESEASSEPQVDPAEQKVEEELASMSLEQKVGQLFMVRNNGKGGLAKTVSQTHAGGVILFAEDFKGKTADQVRDMISELQTASDGKMFVAVDEEGGTVVRVSSNTQLRSSKFLSPQRLYAKGGFDLITTDTQEKCELLDSLGINMNMAPVADVCTEKSAFMYKRSFGKGPEETAEYVSTVVKAMRMMSVASCVKHFPGYGNSKSDTHKGLDTNEKSFDELKESDLVPFDAAIRDGADAIMLTHTVVKSLDPDNPASLSSESVDLLREEMGFEGLLITDGLEMGAIIDFSGGDSGKVCVMAVQAGVDILCAPKNPVSDYNAVLQAVKDGDISESRIDESVRRILRTKIRLGLYE
jgi:Beta-glucosidase-related glycosidases